MDIQHYFDSYLKNPMLIHEVEDAMLDEFGVSISILRSDLIHPELSGNKWFKLKYNLIEAREQGYDRILSFGGSWSNHIHALSAAGKMFDFKTIGVIRGQQGDELNACLSDAEQNGMYLHCVDREDYRHKHEDDFIDDLRQKFGNFYLIPEGGANQAGIKGCGEILSSGLAEQYDLVCLACGTGSSLAGILSASTPPVLGFQVLKGQGYLKREIDDLLLEHNISAKNKWAINDEYHFGGYGKVKPELMQFINKFYKDTGLPVEHVYSGKMLFGIYDLIKKNHFTNKEKILVIHGGGIQGRRGLEEFEKPENH